MGLKAALITITAFGVAMAPWATAPALANITYSINQTSTTPEVAGEMMPLSDTVLGTITTDGTIGAIHTSNILDYNLQLIDNFRPTFDFTLTSADSGIWYDTLDGLTAGATTLSFNFSDAGAVFIIQGTTPHSFSSGFNYFCFQATSGPCLAGETIVPNYFAVDGVVASGLSGTMPLGVPEPATWAMMLVGMGTVGLAMRRRTSINLSYT